MQSLSLALVAMNVLASSSPQAEQRESIQRKLKLQRSSDAPAPTEPAAEPAPAAPPTAPATPQRASARAALNYFQDIRPVLQAQCSACHDQGRMAGATRLTFGADPAHDYAQVLSLVDRGEPSASSLLVKGRGERHGGGKAYEPAQQSYQQVLAWISAGAPYSAQGAVAPAPKSAASPPQPSPAAASSAGPPAAAPVAAPEQSPPSPVAPSDASEIAFVPAVHTTLLAHCGTCHAPGAFAAQSGYVAAAEPREHYQSVAALVSHTSPEESPLLRRALGEQHGGGPVWQANAPEVAQLERWLRAGAPFDGSPAVATPGASAPTPAASKPPASTAAPYHHGHPSGIALFRGFHLNGRFDVSYERTGYHDQPFTGGVDALRSYHHFLFLTRQSAGDPFGLTAELLTLQFWAGTFTHTFEQGLRLTAQLGKILVPFGPEPLYHHSYGGHSGFDQRVLPVIWAQEGATVGLQGTLGPLRISDDLYLVRGYGLRGEDAVLNLQGDVSNVDEVKLAVGNRLGVAWGPVTLWYSLFSNGLGFGRRLFMQALDLSVWRPQDVPVLEYFTLGLGLLRADVSGGGPGNDYYHFASYIQARYYPLPWLYLQYRQGLRTFNNRRGVYIDDTRLDGSDGSTHNVAVVGRYGGFSVGVFHFWNLEKAAEVENDLLRVTVGYEF